jgi:hypothetical protein
MTSLTKMIQQLSRKAEWWNGESRKSVGMSSIAQYSEEKKSCMLASTSEVSKGGRLVKSRRAETERCEAGINAT